MSLAWNDPALATRIGNCADRAAEVHMSTAPHPELSQRARLSYGQPVSDLMARALANPELISLAAGFVDQQTLPCDETYESLRVLCSARPAAQQALQYGTTAGYLPLREAIVQRLQERDGNDKPYGFGIDQVVLTAGSNQLLHLVAETLLDPGDVICCSSPTYFVFLGTLRNLGATAIGLASDEEGLIPEALDDQLRTMERQGQLERVKAIYLVSYFDNPRGITLSAPRRRRSSRSVVAGRFARKSMSLTMRRIASCVTEATTFPACCTTTRPPNTPSRREPSPSRTRRDCVSAGASCRRNWWSRSATRRATSISGRPISISI